MPSALQPRKTLYANTVDPVEFVVPKNNIEATS